MSALTIVLSVVDDPAVVRIETTLDCFCLRFLADTGVARVGLREMHGTLSRPAAANGSLETRTALGRHLDELRIGLVARPLIHELIGILVRMILSRLIRECKPFTVI